MKRLLLSLVFLGFTSLGFAQKKSEYAGVPSLVKEAKEKGNFRLADSLAQDYINDYLFKLKEDQLMNKDNLLFISENLNTADSRGFKLFFKRRNKINSFLGPDKAEYAIRSAIDKQFLPKAIRENLPGVDWGSTEHIVTVKFGSIGQETIYGRKMAYYHNIKDWSNFGKYYLLYFEKALKRSEFDFNEVTWPLFENVSDPNILSFACNVVMKYAMREKYQNDWRAYDTYANLLYKTGKKDQAIEWEEKAMKLSNNDKEILQNLEKMKTNEKTWKETISNP